MFPKINYNFVQSLALGFMNSTVILPGFYWERDVGVTVTAGVGVGVIVTMTVGVGVSVGVTVGVANLKPVNLKYKVPGVIE